MTGVAVRDADTRRRCRPREQVVGDLIHVGPMLSYLSSQILDLTRYTKT